MTIIVLQKKYICWWIWGLLIVGLLLFNQQFIRETITSKYQIRKAFPPLIFLPGYEKGPKIHASAGILIELQSGSVLYAKNAEERRAPASTTKMMTAIVALEKGRLNQIIKVSRKAAATGGSSIWLKPGDRLSLAELLEGIMLRSGNDGSVAVAEGISGSVKNFAGLMNVKAKEIGALKTNFQNPHGLRAPSHYTTALDLALIARYALGNPQFAKLVSSKTGKLEWYEGQKQIEIKNTNRLLWYLEGADGVKTGTTNEAGHCLVASATREGKRFIAVVLNSGDRWGDCARLLEYGFKEFRIVTIAEHNQGVCKIGVIKGNHPTITLYPRSDLVAVVRNDLISWLKKNLVIPRRSVQAPIYRGDVLGAIGYSFREESVTRVDLVTHQAIKRRWWPFW